MVSTSKQKNRDPGATPNAKEKKNPLTRPFPETHHYKFWRWRGTAVPQVFLPIKWTLLPACVQEIFLS
jgi:hypothetical protein